MNTIDKVCVVTGAAGAIGSAIARGLIERGARVVFADRSDAVKELAQQVSKPQQSRSFVLDVCQRSQIKDLLEYTKVEFGRLDVMFNNAAIVHTQPFFDVTEEDWHQTLNINALAVLLASQEAARMMIEQPKKGRLAGKIINTASTASRQAYGDFATYAASKFAVVALTQAAARALAPQNITVNAFAPGIVNTRMWDQIDEEFYESGKVSEPGAARKEFVKNIPLGRAADPQDIAGTAMFLASSDSDYMTAQVVLIDGGMQPL